MLLPLLLLYYIRCNNNAIPPGKYVLQFEEHALCILYMLVETHQFSGFFWAARPSNDASLEFHSSSSGFSHDIPCILAAPVQVLSEQLYSSHITEKSNFVQVFHPKTNSWSTSIWHLG
jgi:hypothetical protein